MFIISTCGNPVHCRIVTSWWSPNNLKEDTLGPTYLKSTCLEFLHMSNQTLCTKYIHPIDNNVKSPCYLKLKFLLSQFFRNEVWVKFDKCQRQNWKLMILTKVNFDQVCSGQCIFFHVIWRSSCNHNFTVYWVCTCGNCEHDSMHHFCKKKKKKKVMC